MAESLSAAEVGQEIAEHNKHATKGGDRRLAIVEAVLLSVVALLAAYSGYAAAKWGTESSVTLAEASAQRSKANRADTEAIVTRTLDSASFDAWFTAFTAGDAKAQQIARRRMRPAYRQAFDAWLKTDPANNPHAPLAPSYMPEYRRSGIPQATTAKALDAKAEAAFATGAEAGSRADRYVRVTVFLATVLFLVGISGQVALRAARRGMVATGGLLLVFSVIQLLGLPTPPSG
jgi:hypothetical protein